MNVEDLKLALDSATETKCQLLDISICASAVEALILLPMIERASQLESQVASLLSAVKS